MSDDPKKESGGMVAAAGQIGLAVTIGLPGASAVAAAGEIVFVGIRQLPKAIKENRPNIIVAAPTWWPVVLFYVFVAVVAVHLLFPNILALKGLSFGYNVELCPKFTYKGAELSNCVKLTKPSAQPSSH